MKLTLSLLLCLACSCGSTGSLSDVRLGMSEAEVERLLGAPADEIRAACGPGSPSVFVYQGALVGPPGERTTVSFIDGRVTHVVRRGEVILAAPEPIADCTTGVRPPAAP